MATDGHHAKEKNAQIAKNVVDVVDKNNLENYFTFFYLN
jgi:hypothetical protein